jgi:DNA-binding MarR family transcriptional regulator
MADAEWLDAREARLWQSYRDTHRDLMRALEARLIGNSGLSGADYALMHPLSIAEDGVLRTRDLGKSVGWERSRLSHQVSRMETRGLVCREDCEHDQRGYMVRLTKAGRKAVEAATPEHLETVRRYFFEPLSRRDQQALRRILESMLAGLDDPDC